MMTVYTTLSLCYVFLVMNHPSFQKKIIINTTLFKLRCRQSNSSNLRCYTWFYRRSRLMMLSKLCLFQLFYFEGSVYSIQLSLARLLINKILFYYLPIVTALNFRYLLLFYLGRMYPQSDLRLLQSIFEIKLHFYLHFLQFIVYKKNKRSVIYTCITLQRVYF